MMWMGMKMMTTMRKSMKMKQEQTKVKAEAGTKADAEQLCRSRRRCLMPEIGCCPNARPACHVKRRPEPRAPRRS